MVNSATCENRAVRPPSFEGFGFALLLAAVALCRMPRVGVCSCSAGNFTVAHMYVPFMYVLTVLTGVFPQGDSSGECAMDLLFNEQPYAQQQGGVAVQRRGRRASGGSGGLIECTRFCGGLRRHAQ